MPALRLAFLWHQHQPYYKNPISGYYEMPWTRLHAVKDYYDLAAILDDFPSIKFNINLVPSLMLQLEDYASGGARDKVIEATLADASALSASDAVFILENFFMANYGTMIEPYPRYAELLQSRGRSTSPEDIKRAASGFKKQDWRDLQVWFNLAWTDSYWRRKDAFIDGLFKKGKNFTEEEKSTLIKKHLEICGAIIPKHRDLQTAGRAEISTTPFYHPILPLLCDTDTARMSIPSTQLPANRFRRPDDARSQILKAADFYESRFGIRPRGFWPSEGSVSEEVARMFADCGVRWLATDEEVLFRSFAASMSPSDSRAAIYEPWRMDSPSGGHIDMFFRDHALSDAIGFVYSGWPPAAAATDFMKRLDGIKKNRRGGNPPLVNVILDGENCWEYYRNDGEDFLRELLGRISDDKDIETVTYSDYLEGHPASSRLNRLHAGSWINANFAIWIGHSEDNASWDRLYEAREFIAAYIRKNPGKGSSESVKEAMEHLYAAEGSDWNWWYGDDHGSQQDTLFDLLYRSHLKKIYEVLGSDPPGNLEIAIKTGRRTGPPILEPADFLSVKIDGAATNYYEWLSAGFYQTGLAGGSMHQVENIIKAVHYGFDLNNLYIRIDTNLLKDPAKLDQCEFCVKFLNPEGLSVKISFDSRKTIKRYVVERPSVNALMLEVARAERLAAASKVVEMAVPFEFCGTSRGEKLDFAVILLQNDNELERWPYQRIFSIKHPSEDDFNNIWSV